MFLQQPKNTHAHFGESGIDKIKVFTCLFIAKIGICYMFYYEYGCYD